MGYKSSSSNLTTFSAPASEKVFNECDFAPKGFLLRCWDKPPTAQLRSEPTIRWRDCSSAVQKVSVDYYSALRCGFVFAGLTELVQHDVLLQAKPDLFVLKAASQWKGFQLFRVKQHTLICQSLLCLYTPNLVRNMLIVQTDGCWSASHF